MTIDQVRARLELHERMRELHRRAGRAGLVICWAEDRRGVDVLTPHRWAPGAVAGERLMVLQEVLAEEPSMVEFLEYTDRIAAVVDGHRTAEVGSPSPPEHQAPAPRMPAWLLAAAALVLAVVTGQLVWTLLHRAVDGQ